MWFRKLILDYSGYSDVRPTAGVQIEDLRGEIISRKTDKPHISGVYAVVNSNNANNVPENAELFNMICRTGVESFTRNFNRSQPYE